MRPGRQRERWPAGRPRRSGGVFSGGRGAFPALAEAGRGGFAAAGTIYNLFKLAGHKRIDIGGQW